MGTRADFYIGIGDEAEYLGSIGNDGYPDGMTDRLLNASTADEFRDALAIMASNTDDFSDPVKHGWPWSWDNSYTTDYAYAFHGGKVMCSCFGREWRPVKEYIANENDEDWFDSLEELAAEVPDMSKRKNPTLGPRSGLIVLS